MQTIDFLEDAFLYNYWANRCLLNDLLTAPNICDAKLPISFGSIHKLVAHVYYYEAKTYNRLVKPVFNLNNIKNLNQDKLFRLILECSDKWVTWIQAVNLDQIGETIVSEILALQNHNNYHRGQITSALMMLGHKPKSLDIYLYLNTVTCA